MKKVIRIVCLSLLLATLMGYSPKSEEHQMMFDVGIDELADIQANHPFVIRGYLRNTASHAQQIHHGAGMFTYEIVDSEGRLVPHNNKTLIQNDIGYVKYLMPEDMYQNNGEEHRSRAFYEFTLPSQGTYGVRVIADFYVADEEMIDKNMKLSSELHEFIVK